jgi:hypothetical protein
VRDDPPSAPHGSHDLQVSGTARHAPITRVDGRARDLLHSDLEVAFDPTRPRRHSDTPVDAMSWDVEHGFRTAAPASTLRMLRRRAGAPVAPTPDDAVAGDDHHSWSSASAVELRYVAAPGPRIERPPSDLVDVVRQATGVDVTGTRIDRSAEVTGRAAAMGAIAFTDNDTVHLPAELGPHDEGPTRAVLAHELTHVAQRRSGAGPAPGEHTSEGVELEHQARAVQRAVDDRSPVVPSYLRTAPVAPSTPPGVQRLGTDDDRFDWQHRGAPPSERGARAAFGFGFLRHDPDSAEGRGQAVADRQWAERYEADHADELQRRRDVRYAEMVAEAEREIQIQNLREERSGDEVLELERRDILSLRRRLDQEMPWEFGPPATIDELYPPDPPLPAEDPPRRASVRTAPAAAAAVTAATTIGASASAGAAHGAVPDAPTIGRDSVARRSPPLRHPSAARTAMGSSAEPDTSWQHRPSTTREQIGAVFGGTFGQLLSASVSDGDDEAERRRAESAPAVMERRRVRERELRHVELRARSIAARREDESGAASLDSDTIERIRQMVDTEMPLEFEMPDYLERDVDVHIDAEGSIGPAVMEPTAAPPAGDTETAPVTSDATATTALSAADAGAGALAATTPTADEHTADAPPGAGGTGTAAPTAPTTTTATTATTAVAAGEASPSPAAALAAGVALGAVAAHLDDGDDQTAASRVFDAASDLDLDQLARRLYGRFRRDLRRELLIDRERAGTLADAC